MDELSASVERIGGIGLTIHDELLAQVHHSCPSQELPPMIVSCVFTITSNLVSHFHGF